MLGLAGGICANLLCPVHSCYVMTLEYYRAAMGKTYRLLLAPAILTFLVGGHVWGCPVALRTVMRCGFHANGGGEGGNSPRSKASRAALTGMPASQGTPTWHNPQPYPSNL